MIPSDIASHLRQTTQDLQPQNQTGPVLPATKLSDLLSDFQPGQRILAQIQGLLPNGAYRAVVAQREITLSLPFSANLGDSLELEIQENQGEFSLAFISNKTSASTSTESSASSTSLSKAGSLIGNLLNEIDQNGGKAKPAPLNSSLALTSVFPTSAEDLAPILKQAISQSGMFYESHQAQWLEGKISTGDLLSEPQGQHSQLKPGTLRDLSTQSAQASLAQTAPSQALQVPVADQSDKASEFNKLQLNQTPSSAEATVPSNQAGFSDKSTTPTQNSIPNELTPLVQQQLNALATHTFAWQGQIWPGQVMDWEIRDEEKQGNMDEAPYRWQTRLQLTLPNLGNVKAALHLTTDGKLDIGISATDQTTCDQMQQAALQLQNALSDAGLNLTQLGIRLESQQTTSP